MRGNRHKFPVLQQDLPKNRDIKNNEDKFKNKKHKEPKETAEVNENEKKSNQNENNDDDMGNFFDEVIVQEENKLNADTNIEEKKQKKEKKKILTFKPEFLLDKNKGLKALYTNIEKYKLIVPENTQNFDEV